MTLAWLPTAVRDDHDPQHFPWAETTDPKGCLHTTETTGKPSYDGWTIEPHGSVVAHPGVGVTVYQHVPLTQASFSLRHTRPQPTNGDYVFQWELVGTCDPSRHDGAYRWFEADDAVLLDLWRKLIKPLNAAYGIPMRARPFFAYPYPAGANRLTDQAFDTYSGWLGHQHVPQNDHGDPGAFPWDRLAALAAHDLPGDDVTPQDIKAIADAVLDEPIVLPWDSKPHSLRGVIAQLHFYGLSAGFSGNIPPTASTGPGNPTTAKAVLDQLEAIGQVVNDLKTLLASQHLPGA